LAERHVEMHEPGSGGLDQSLDRVRAILRVGDEFLHGVRGVAASRNVGRHGSDLSCWNCAALCAGERLHSRCNGQQRERRTNSPAAGSRPCAASNQAETLLKPFHVPELLWRLNALFAIPPLMTEAV